MAYYIILYIFLYATFLALIRLNRKNKYTHLIQQICFIMMLTVPQKIACNMPKNILLSKSKQM
jgi:hypothetical protein